MAKTKIDTLFFVDLRVTNGKTDYLFRYKAGERYEFVPFTDGRELAQCVEHYLGAMHSEVTYRRRRKWCPLCARILWEREAAKQKKR